MASILKKHQLTDSGVVPPDRSAGPPAVTDAQVASQSARAVPHTSGSRSGAVRVIKQGGETGGGEKPSGASGPTQSPIAKKGVASLISGATLGSKGSGATGLVEFNLADLAEQGREQIQRCQQQIETMLASARKQSEQIKADAKALGQAEGIAKAAAEIDKRIQAEAEAKAKAQVASLQKAVLEMREQYDRWMHEYAEVLTSTALAATERVVRREIRLPAETGADSDRDGQEHLLVRWAREALHSTRSASRLTLAVHPDTLAELGKPLDELLAHPDLPEQSIVIPDETLQIGEVVVRQDGGEISAGLDAQLRRLDEELR